MANTAHFNMTDPETVLKWERELHVQIALKTPLFNKKYGFIGDDDTSLCQRKRRVWESEEGGGGGTRATVTLRRRARGRPTYGNTPLRDREETINTSTFTWDINQVRHAIAQRGRINPKRVSWNLWKESTTALGEWWAEISESAAMLHLAGVPYDVSTAAEWYHVGNDLGHTFCNAPTVPDSKHIYRIGNLSDTNDSNVGLDPAAVIDVDTISTLKAIAKNLPIPMRPCTIHGKELYVFFAHSWALRHMKSNSRWMAEMRAAMQGGQVDGHPFWTGALGIWDEVLIVENNYIPPGVSSTNTRVSDARRNVFCGAQALVMGIAKEFDNANMFKSDEENWDYGNNRGLAATSILGLACPRYSIVEQGTTEDFARIVCVSYAKELVTSA